MRTFVTKVDGTAPAPSGILSALEDNTRFAELKNAVVTAGITPDPINPPEGYVEDRQMLAQAFARYSSSAVFCLDSGGTNAYVLKALGAVQPPKMYFTGLRVVFYPVTSGTGASTINAFSLGSKKLFRPDGSAVRNGDIAANRLVDAFFDETLDGGAGAFRLVPWAIPAAVLAPSIVPSSGEGISVDNLYQISLNFPSLAHGLPVSADVFPFYSNAGLHHRIISLSALIALVQATVPSISYSQVAPTMQIEERRPNLTKRKAVHNAWAARPLSDVIINQIANSAFSGNQVSLPPGTYRSDWVSVIAKCGNHRSRLFDVTAQKMIGSGSASDSFSGKKDSPSTPSLGTTWFQIPAGPPHVIQLQYWANDQGVDDPYLGDAEVNDIGSGNYYVDGWLSIVKES